MALAGVPDVDQQVEEEDQETRRITVVLDERIHMISQPFNEDRAGLGIRSGTGFSRHLSRPLHHCLAEEPHSTLCYCFRAARHCCFPRLYGGPSSRFSVFCTRLAEKCSFRMLLLIYVCLNEVLRYHSDGGTVTVAAAISEAILVLVLLVEFVYDSISLGLWRGNAQLFRSRRCVYNFVVLLAAVACGALEILARKKPPWYTAPFALAGALGRFIRLFRVYQSSSFQVVHSIFKKSSFNLLALGGLCFLFALFYTILFFHSYGYTQFNLCYKEPSSTDANVAKIQNEDPQNKASTNSSWNPACNSSVTRTSLCDCRYDASEFCFKQGTLRRSTKSVKTPLDAASASSSGLGMEMFCDASSRFWEFDTTQQYLCTPGRACRTGTTCRNVFDGRWTTTCSEAERRRLYRAGWDLVFKNPVADWGTTGFHSGISALTSLLECMTLEGWSAMMYRQADGDSATRGVLSFVLILSVVVLGNLLLMNLVVAVVWENTIIESTTLKKIDARDEDLQLFEILGMKWVRHLVQQLSRHDIFSSEEKMVAYQLAKKDAQRNKDTIRSTHTSTVTGTAGNDMRSAAEPLRAQAADPTRSIARLSGVSPRTVSVVRPSALVDSSAPSLRASCAAACSTPHPAPSIVCGSSRDAGPLISPPKATSVSHASLRFPEYTGSGSFPADAVGHPLLTADAPALFPSCHSTASPSRITCVFSRLRLYWSRFCSCVFRAISRKRYVALMFCTAFADLCCIVACTRTDREFVKLTVDCIFTSIYVLDICLQLIGFGWRHFIQDGFKVYDLTVVSVEVVGLVFHFTCCGKAVSSCLAKRIYPASPFLLNAYIFFRSFHAFRIFKLIRNFAALRILVELMHDLLRNIFFIYVLVLFEVFTVSLMGVICFGDSHFEKRASEVGFPTITRFFNFSNIWKAFMLTYGLMTGESWNVVMSEFFAVYVEYDYSPSKEEALLPSHLFLKTPRLGYLITTYVFITVVLLCCFIFNVFGGILIGQFVTSRRLVYNRHVFKLINICRELGIEMPSQKAVVSSNLQRMYSLVESKSKGPTARIRALSLFLQPEKLQERFSAASASPKARRIITRVSSSISKRTRSSISSSRAANPLATPVKHGRLPAVIQYYAERGGRNKHVRRMWNVTQSKQVLPKLRSRRFYPTACGTQQRKAPAGRISSKEADGGITPGAPSPVEPSSTSNNQKVWAISHGSKTRSCLFYAVSHEDFDRKYKSPHQETPVSTRVCSFVRTSCLSLAIGLVWIFDAIVRLFFFCRLLLESQLVSLDTERPDFCIAYVHYILEDEYVVEHPDEHEQGSSSAMSSSVHPQLRTEERASTSSTGSHRRATTELPHFSLGGRIHSFLYTLMVSDYYDLFLAGINVTSLLCLIVEACLTENTTASLCFACLESVFAAFFLFENALRMFTFGLLAGTAGTNAIHFCLSLISVVVLLCNQAWLFSSALQTAYAHFWLTPAFRAVKLLRSLRALQLLDTLHMSGIKIVAQSLAASIGEMKNLGVLLMLVFLVAGAIITQITQCFTSTNVTSSRAGASSTNLSPTGRRFTGDWRTEDLSSFTSSMPVNKSLISLNHGRARNLLKTHSVVSPSLNAEILPAPSLAERSNFTRLTYEGSYTSRAAPYTFDNMTESLLGVFVLSTAEGWPLILAQLLQHQPKQQRTILTVVVFVFVSLVAVFCVNLFVGIIVEASRRKKTRMETQGSLLSPAIHKWIEVQKILFDAPLQHGDTVPNFDQTGHKRLVWLRKGAAAIVTRSSYHYFDLAQIFLFCLVLLFYGPWYNVLMGQAARVTNTMCCLVALVLCCCFVAGIMLKFVARGRLFFKDKLDILDLLIFIALSMRIGSALLFREQWKSLERNFLSAFWPMSFRLFRVTRFLYRHVYFFRTLFTTISGVAKAFLIALGLLGIALFFFALWGVLLFHDSPVQNYTNKYANFTSLPAAFMAVIGACTGEDWHLMLQQMRLYYTQKKQTTLAFLVVVFFSAFIIMVFFTLMSLFTSTVLEKYMETVRNESLWKISRQHGRLLDLWTPDEDGTLFKTPEATLHILWSIDFPIGLKNAVPPVESPEAAYALLAKFELPLYYCNKGKNATNCDSKKISSGKGETATYKIHIRDVVLNAARRACKYHALSNGEGVLQEGQVHLDPRLIQSWVAKYPELCRLGCSYNLKHFNAAALIQVSWRRRHLFVKGHIANPDWCVRYILESLRTLVANKHQNAPGRSRRSSQGDARRDTGKEEREREKRTSTESSCNHETPAARDMSSPKHKKRSRTASKQKSWRMVSAVFEGSRQPSCARCRSRCGSGAEGRQLAGQEAPSQAYHAQDRGHGNNSSLVLKTAAPDQTCQEVPVSRRDCASAPAVPKTRQMRPSKPTLGGGRSSTASNAHSRQSQQSPSSIRVEKNSIHGPRHQPSSQTGRSTPASADNARTNPSAHGRHPQRMWASEELRKEDVTFQLSVSRQSPVYGVDVEGMKAPAYGRHSQRARASTSQSKCEILKKDDATCGKATLRHSVSHGGDDEQMSSPARRRRSQKSRSSASQMKCEESENHGTSSRRFTAKQSVIYECDGEQVGPPGHRRRSRRSRGSASQLKCEGSEIDDATRRRSRSRQSVRHAGNEEQTGVPASRRNSSKTRDSPSQAEFKGSEITESPTQFTSRQQVLYGGDETQVGPSAPKRRLQRSREPASPLRGGESKDQDFTSRPFTPEHLVLYGSDAEHLDPPAPEEHWQRKSASAAQAKCEESKDEGATSPNATPKESDVFEGEGEHSSPPTHSWQSPRSRGSPFQVNCEGPNTDDTTPRNSASRQSVIYGSGENRISPRAPLQHSNRRRRFTSQVNYEESKNVAATFQRSRMRQSVKYGGTEEQVDLPAWVQHPQRRRASAPQAEVDDGKNADTRAHKLTARDPLAYGVMKGQMKPPARGWPLLRRKLSAPPVSLNESENDDSMARQPVSRESIVNVVDEVGNTPRDRMKHSQERETSASWVKCENSDGEDRNPHRLASRQSVLYEGHAARMSPRAPVEYSQRKRVSGSQEKYNVSGSNHATSQESTARKPERDRSLNTADISDGATGAALCGEDPRLNRGHTESRNSASRTLEATSVVRKALSGGSVRISREAEVLGGVVEHLPGQVIAWSAAHTSASPHPVFNRGDSVQRGEDRFFPNIDRATSASKRRRSADGTDMGGASGKYRAIHLTREAISGIRHLDAIMDLAFTHRS